MKRFLLCLMCSVFLLSASPAFAEGKIDYIYSLLNGFHATPAEDGKAAPSAMEYSELTGLSDKSSTLVPSEAAALGVVEALIRGKHGEDVLKNNQPLSVRRDGEFWIVEGIERKPGLSRSTVRISRVDAHVDSFKVFLYSEHPPFQQTTTQSKDDCHAACHDVPASGAAP
jgi:hypothetical protein